MTDENVPRFTVAIDEPKIEMVRCVAAECGREVPKHEAWRVTVEAWEPIPPDTSHQVEWHTGTAATPWDRSVRLWSARAAAMLTAAAPQMPGPVYTPAATHAIYTYTGFGCTEDHASKGAMELDHQP